MLLTASFARAVAQVAATLDDPTLCDHDQLLELLALADRAEHALTGREDELETPG